ncbi:MAG: hypothetical protein L0Y54_11290, partial [Sporichthyaceae bacterium]|nr:hypothetical protein [Sporichthyaceae bacterium]
ALAAEPELLVLDEPMSGVDAPSQVAFAEALAAFVAQGGTAILVAHELGHLEPLVTRAVVIDDGTAREASVPVPAAASRDPVHPHAPHDPPGIWPAG